MKTIKKFWNDKIKTPSKNFLESIDSKVDPDVGFDMYKLFRYLSLFWFFVVFPIISLLIGTNAYYYIQGFEQFMDPLGLWLLIGFFFLFLLFFYSMWFYFSKWNDLVGKVKIAWKSDKKQVKLNKKLAKHEDKKLKKATQIGGSL